MNTTPNRRPVHPDANTTSRSAHDLIANAADNTTTAPINHPYRPRTRNARSVTR
ncbi:hypothetical protein AB0J14_05070 [Micromonospora arborensis]|uniref:hypothetical protein n=1 Tax=Micromonospora arborensis TaxID=2116518 RepID=UPI0033C15DF3